MSDGDKELDDVQVPPGWGLICCECKHVFKDEQKYIAMPPFTPCRKLKHTRGGYDRDTMQYESPGLIWQLRRYVDGTESCESFEKAEEASGDE